MELYFDPTLIPRTVTRGEWQDMWRWKRTTEKRLQAERSSAVHNLAAYGSAMLPEQRAEAIDRMVFPPLLLGPFMDRATS